MYPAISCLSLPFANLVDTTDKREIMSQKEVQKVYFELMTKIRELGEPICSAPENQDLFFAEAPVGDYNSFDMRKFREDQEDAVLLCGVCPVRAMCAEYAIIGREEFGVWGGTTPAQRQAINKYRYKPVDKD
jgi:hypothetical protein